MSPHRIRLIAAVTAAGEGRAKTLRASGFVVESGPLTPAAVRRLDPGPDAFVIDLSRAPSVGRDMALFIRQVAATRRVPLVFAGGEPQAVASIRRLLPDAIYTSWAGVAGAVKEAIVHPVADPVSPGVFAPFAGVPLAKKLGIKAEAVVALVDAPRAFQATLGALPAGVRVRRGRGGAADITLWFVRTRRALEDGIGGMKSRAQHAGLWILWPKTAKGAPPNVNQLVVRKVGLANGLVDFKISAIDASWSGLRFTLRKGR